MGSYSVKTVHCRLFIEDCSQLKAPQDAFSLHLLKRMINAIDCVRSQIPNPLRGITLGRSRIAGCSAVRPERPKPLGEEEGESDLESNAAW